MTLTGWPILDPLVAILVAGLIVKEAWHLVDRSFAPLMDGRLTDEEHRELTQLLDGFVGEATAYHDLKARRAGHKIFVELHLTLPGQTPLEVAHALADRIEAVLASRWEHAEALIHMEPNT